MNTLKSQDTWVIFINNYLDYDAYRNLDEAKEKVEFYSGSNNLELIEESRMLIKYVAGKDEFTIRLVKVK